MANRDDPETCDDCGAIVGGNPDCGTCRDWVYRDARRPTSPENDERDPTVPAGTSPLPYVELGMRVVHPDDGAKWWEVESIHADDSLGLRDHTVCALRSNDARRLSDMPSEVVRTWKLAEDFDPNEPHEPVPAYAERTEERIRERYNDREYPRSVEEDVAFLLGELDSARLGCEIAYRREPTREEMHAALAASRDGEAFIAMGGWTARTCRVCGEPVAGGPTACVLCVERETIADLRAKLARAEADRCPQLEDFGPGPERMCSACCVVLDKPHTWEECAIGQREAWVTEHAARVLAEKRLAGARAATKLREAFARDIAEIKRDRDAATARAERAEAAGPALVSSTDEHGERGGSLECSNCGEVRDEPHTWRECAEWLRKSRDVCLYAAHKAIADIQRALGADEDDANANYSDALDLAREVSGKVDDLERALRVSTELRDEARVARDRAEAEAAAMRRELQRLAEGEPGSQAFDWQEFAESLRRSAANALDEHVDAGAALLCEVEAGRRLRDAARSLYDGADCLPEPPALWDALFHALAACDAARGAR